MFIVAAYAQTIIFILDIQQQASKCKKKLPACLHKLHT